MTMSLQTLLDENRRQLIKADRQVSSDRKQVGIPVEVEMVLDQVRDNESSFFSPDEDCECGGTLDEGRCDSCDNGHDDCEIQGCFDCYERAMDRAESAAEGMER